MSPSLQVLVNSVAGFVLQLVVLGGIPLCVYVISRRRLSGFFAWIGLRRAPVRIVLAACGVALLLALTQLAIAWSLLKQPGTVSGDLLALRDKQGWSAALIAMLVITAWLKTALTEEIFFRGFIAERLIGWLGFRRGNVVQALLFGLVHAPILFVLPRDQRLGAVAIISLLGPIVGGWIMGYFNHQKAGGSILPSICMHGLGNTLAYAVPLILA